VLRHYADKVEVIPLGLADRSTNVDQGKVEQWRARFPRPFILFTGALRYYKAIGVLLEAARISGLPVIIVGSGPKEAQWRAKAESLGLANVHFVGGVPDEDKDALLNLCTALVMPSNVRSEAFGLSLVEAAMFSKPMVSCDIATGTSYVNVHGETGFVVPPSNPQALAGAMNRLVDETELATELGAAARRHYEALFTRETMAASYLSLYRRLANASGRDQQQV
jgi:rhamnosyl/mannosyltransferase